MEPVIERLAPSPGVGSRASRVQPWLREETRGPWGARLLLVGLWWLALWVANTQGNFPLNDDWSYADTLQRLLQGHYAPHPWTSMPLLSNLAWGGAFSQVLGFSNDALRHSTQVAGLLGGLGTFELLRRLGKPLALCWVGAACLMFNPIHLLLANTFMTDVLFTTLFTWGLWAGVGLQQKPTTARWCLFGALCVAATLSRQLGLALAAGQLLACLCAWNRPRSAGWLAAAAVLALCAGALWAHQHHLATHGLTPAMATAQSGRLFDVLHNPKWLVSNVITLTGASAQYVALLAAPVVWLALCSPFARNAPALPLAPWRAAVAGVMAAAALAIGFRQTGHAMPWLTNIVTPEGLGPFTLSDIAQWNLPAPENWLGVAWPLLCAWCMVAVLAGVSMLWAWPRAEGWLHTVRHTAAPTQFLVATALVYLAPLLLSGMFDRYLLPTLPVACALLLFRQPPRPAMVAATGLLVGMALASTVLVHDHFAWQRARWALIDHARHTLHVAEADLDGGFEHTWPQFYQHANAEQTAQGPVWAERRCTISFHGQRAGHTSVAQRAASTWATRGPTALHLLCRP